MAKQLIISISREFGSGGHAIAELLAKKFELPLYDRNILDEIAKEKGIETEHLQGFDEKPRNPLLTRRVRGYSNSMEEAIAEMQFDYIRKKAESGESFVVLGRCAETVLRGTEGLVTIFVRGDKPCKIERVMERYDLSKSEAVAKMARHDRHRKSYHNAHSDMKWGDSRGYDLCINSSVLGIEGTADMLTKYIEACAASKE